MNPLYFVLALGVGSALLAVWTEVRFPTVAPSDLGRLLFHGLACAAVARYAVPRGIDLAVERQQVLAGIFLVGLPALIYCFLVGFWTLRFVSDKLAGHMR